MHIATRPHFQVRRLVVTAMLAAIVLILMFTGLGFIPFLVFAVTLYHIPVLLAVQSEGWTAGFAVAFMFGATSLYKAATAPGGIYDPLFVNPLVSILPRLLIVPAAMLGLKLFKKNRRLSCAASALLGTLANTVFTLSAVSLAIWIAPGAVGLTAGRAATVAIGAIWASSAVNALMECALAVAVVTAVMSALDRIYKR